jgi:hypothetical protein
MVASVNDFAGSRSNGLFVNSCFAHCQSELPATWSDAAGGAAPAIQSRVTMTPPTVHAIHIDIYIHIKAKV